MEPPPLLPYKNQVTYYIHLCLRQVLTKNTSIKLILETELAVWVTCLMTYYQEAGSMRRWVWEPFSLLWCFSEPPYWEITLINTKKDQFGLFLHHKAPSDILASLRMRAATEPNLCLNYLFLSSPPPTCTHPGIWAYFPFTEALNLILVVPTAGSGPLSDSLNPPWLFGLVLMRCQEFILKSLTHVFLLLQRSWVRDTE